jgi:hypothetical protein
MMSAKQIQQFAEDVRVSELAILHIQKQSELEKWKQELLPFVEATKKEIEEGIKRYIRESPLSIHSNQYNQYIGTGKEAKWLAEVVKNDLDKLGYYVDLVRFVMPLAESEYDYGYKLVVQW